DYSCVHAVQALRSAGYETGPGTRTDVPAGAAVADGRQRRRGPLVGAAAAMLVALVGLGAALAATRNVGEDPAVNLPATSPTVAPSGPVDLPAANEQITSVEPGRPDRPHVPGNSPSASVSATPSVQPSQTANSPTPTAGVTTAPPTSAAPTTAAPPTTSAPPDPPATSSPPLDPEVPAGG
ncbi:serine/threonine protein kinase, partial [Micromonospora sp. NPDC048843]